MIIQIWQQSEHVRIFQHRWIKWAGGGGGGLLFDYMNQPTATADQNLTFQ